MKLGVQLLSSPFYKVLLCSILLVLCLSVFHFNSGAQTLVGLSIGNELSTTPGISCFGLGCQLQYEFTDKGYSVYSPTLGIRIEQYLPLNLILSYEGMITQKKLNVEDVGIIVFTKYRFNYIRNSIQLKKEWNGKYRVGAGYGLNFLGAVYKGIYFHQSNSYKFLRTNLHTKDFRAFDEQSLVFSFGYRYKTLVLDLTYVRGININSTPWDFIYFKPIHTFNLSLAWHYNIPWKQKAKPLPCP